VAVHHEDRLRHTSVLGQTGMGKSTLLLRMIADDLEAGHGAAVVDPHGDLLEAALALVPEHRWDDAVLSEPTDPADGDPPAVRGPGLYHLVDEASDRPTGA
jgi:DNA helicase HerA-like ATPase